MNPQDWRKKEGLTQAEVAKLCNTTPATLSRYENGKRNRLDKEFLLKMFVISKGKVTPNDFLENDIKKLKW